VTNSGSAKVIVPKISGINVSVADH